MMNGVIHLVEEVLFPYEDIPTKMRAQPALSQFTGFINEDPQLMQSLTYVGTDVATQKFTVLAPNDMAVSESMRINGPNRLNSGDKRSMELLLKAHILRDELKLSDLYRELQNIQTRPGEVPRYARRITLAGTELRFYRIGNETYVSGGFTFARITPELANIGATNGIIQHIEAFIGKPGRTVIDTFSTFPHLLKLV